MNANSEVIVSAVRRLGSTNPKDRVHAREILADIGSPATWHLIQAVHPPGATTRHEALRVLAASRDPAAADCFVELLDDEDPVCRWYAAQGLAALGAEGLRRALELLVEYPRTEHLLRSLHHVFSDLEKTRYASIVRPVLHAYQDVAHVAQLPAAAVEALSELRRARRPRSGHNTTRAR